MEQMNYAPMPGAPAPVYAKGCLGAAWDDIKQTPGYMGKMVVLGLIMCVPILNFVVAGYLLLWSREVPFGGRTPMPQKYVTGKNFEFGFYAFVISLVVGLVGSVVGGILMFIPILGQLAYVALMLLMAMAIAALQMRMIMGLNFADSFKIKEVWEAGKRNWSQLLLVTIVPNLIAGVVVCVVATLVIAIVALVCLGGAMPTIVSVDSLSYLSTSDIMGLIGLFFGVGFVGFLIVYVIGCVAQVVAQVITIRGMGHWVARYAPEWTAAAAMPTAPATPMGAPVPPTAPVQPASPAAPTPQAPVAPAPQAPAAPAPQAPTAQAPADSQDHPDNPQTPSA